MGRFTPRASHSLQWRPALPLPGMLLLRMDMTNLRFFCHPIAENRSMEISFTMPEDPSELPQSSPSGFANRLLSSFRFAIVLRTRRVPCTNERRRVCTKAVDSSLSVSLFGPNFKSSYHADLLCPNTNIGLQPLNVISQISGGNHFCTRSHNLASPTFPNSAQIPALFSPPKHPGDCS